MKKSILSKALALFIAVLIVAMCAPFVFAAEPVALTEANIVAWPTVSGTIYFGQKLSDGFTLTGGEVQYNGTVVPGKFEFTDANYVPSKFATQYASVKFVPDESDIYVGFENSNNVRYKPSETTPVFVDEINDMPVATNVVAGNKLSTSTISGGTLKNPYNESEATIAAGIWEWTSRRTVVNASGFYEAEFAVPGYTIVTTMVWVNIEGDDSKPVYPAVITEMPTIAEYTYDPNSTVTYNDLFSGGKAVIRGTDTEIEGTFALTEKYQNMKPLPSHQKVEATFTPTDSTIASFVQFEIPVTINPAPIAFIDSEGNRVVDGFVFEVEPNEILNNVLAHIKPYLSIPDNSVIGIENRYGRAENGKQYKLTVIHDDSYYTGAELTFTAKFKETKIEPRLAPVGPNKWRIDCEGYNPEGQFIVYYELNGETRELARVNANSEFDLAPTESGNYTVKVVYDKIENDYFVIDDIVITNDVKLSWTLVATGINGTKTEYSAPVEIIAPATDPAKLNKPYYAFIKWNDANGNTGLTDEQLENEKLNFTMPDGDVELKAEYKFDFIMFIKYIFTTIANWFKSFFASIGTLF